MKRATLPGWLQRRPKAAPAHDAAVDPETGEILDAGEPEPAEAPPGIVGERTLPSVNRERSLQTRVQSAVALGTLMLLALGFLGWYYAGQFARAEEARTAAKKAAESRSAGEMRLAPLGRIEPPKAVSVAASAAEPAMFGQAPPPLPAGPPIPAGPPPGPPPKTPEQLALERRLGQPVLLRSQAGGATAPGSGTAGGAGPNLASLFAGLQPGAGAVDAGAPSALGAALRPTPTPAVAAQVLPTRRFLLPKGAFLDCTLETAIDSTYDGMVTCIGASDTYSADGRVVLLERGTKYVGEKRGELRQGQGRVFVLWTEARTPTGVVVSLASPGTDELGRAGLPGHVESHFWERFGAAILISVVDGLGQALATGRGGDPTVVFGPQGGQGVLTEVLKGTLAIPPTVVKNQGDRIQVLVARDVDFRPVYALRSTGETTN